MWQKLKNIYHFVSAFFANLYYRFPTRNLKVIGVTGTDGKTTVVHLIYEILKQAGKKVAMVSSVKAEVDGQEFETGLHVTTPNPWQLQKIVRRIVDRGGEYLVLEVTSHALDQHRVFGIPFEIGVLTNVTDEHLDYHQTYENYLATKLKLLKSAKVAVVNREDKSYKNFQFSIFNFQLKKGLVTYGITKGDVTSHNFKFSTPLQGKYNQSNCLAAIAATKQLGIDKKMIKKAVSRFEGVIGRFEFIDTNRDFQVMIDFAHTPNAFRQVLKTIRPMVKGRLIHVFGCAGLRDKKKRPVMGEISAQDADIIILTEEDYRTENVNKIIKEISDGCLNKLKTQNSKLKTTTQNLKLFKITDRQRAITKAISLAKKGDLVLLTGKGHEKSLCRGKKEYPWSEHEAVKRALRALN